MRHNVYGKHLGRDKNQRTALFKGLVRSLFLHESITTTESKAKAVRGLVDRLIVKGKEGTTAARNVITSTLSEKEIIRKLTEEIAPRYKNRPSGFTQLVRLGSRAGDGAMLVKMSLIKEKEEKPVTEKKAEVKTEKVKTKTEPKERVTKEEKK